MSPDVTDDVRYRRHGRRHRRRGDVDVTDYRGNGMDGWRSLEPAHRDDNVPRLPGFFCCTAKKNWIGIVAVDPAADLSKRCLGTATSWIRVIAVPVLAQTKRDHDRAAAAPDRSIGAIIGTRAGACLTCVCVQTGYVCNWMWPHDVFSRRDVG